MPLLLFVEYFGTIVALSLVAWVWCWMVALRCPMMISDLRAYVAFDTLFFSESLMLWTLLSWMSCFDMLERLGSFVMFGSSFDSMVCFNIFYVCLAWFGYMVDEIWWSLMALVMTVVVWVWFWDVLVFFFTTSWTVLNSVCICRVVFFLTVGWFLAWVCISSMLNCLLNWALLFWFCVSSSTVLNCLNWAFDLYNLFLLSSLLSAVCCELPLNYA